MILTPTERKMFMEARYKAGNDSNFNLTKYIQIDYGLHWSSSPQGHEYWRQINHRGGDIERYNMFIKKPILLR